MAAATREHVEHGEVGEVMGVDGGPCGVPESEHTTRAGRRPAFAWSRCGTARGIGGFRIRLLANPAFVHRARTYETGGCRIAPASVKSSVNRAEARRGTPAAPRRAA